MPFAHKRFGGYCNITHCCKLHHKTTAKLSPNPTISSSRKSKWNDPPFKVVKTKPFLSMCYDNPSSTKAPPVLWSSHQKTNFLHYTSVTAVKCTIVPVQRIFFRRQQNPRRGYRPKVTGILFVCNEPGRSILYYCAQLLDLSEAKIHRSPTFWLLLWEDCVKRDPWKSE